MPIVLVESFVEKWMSMKLEKFKLFLFESPSIILLSPSYLRSRIKRIKTLAFRYSSTVKIQKSYARHLTTSSFKRLVRDDFLQILLQLYQHSFPRSPIIGIALEWCSMPLQKKKMVRGKTTGCSLTEHESLQISPWSWYTFCIPRQATSPQWHLCHWYCGVPGKLLRDHEAVFEIISLSNLERLSVRSVSSTAWLCPASIHTSVCHFWGWAHDMTWKTILASQTAGQHSWTVMVKIQRLAALATNLSGWHLAGPQAGPCWNGIFHYPHLKALSETWMCLQTRLEEGSVIHRHGYRAHQQPLEWQLAIENLSWLI